jgi:hypothetical protein
MHGRASRGVSTILAANNERFQLVITHRLHRIAIVTAALTALVGQVHASENFDLRYPPGFGGADMSAPLDPGWYFQLLAYSYSGKVKSPTAATVDITAAPFSVPIPGAAANVPLDASVRLKVNALIPRVAYMSSTKWLGATVGFTALLPLAEKESTISAKAGPVAFNAAASLLPAQDQAFIAAGLAQGLAQQAGALSSRSSGLGDLELAPLLRWNLDPAQVLAALSVTLPTGQYDKNKTANASAGNFYTLRPGVQYSAIGDGWDMGVRAGYSVNTRNKDTGYRSGASVNVDWAVSKSLSESLRIGAVGYGFVQTTKDTIDRDPTLAQTLTLGKKGRVFGIGPSLTWIKGSGEMLVEGRATREFSAKDRPEGNSVWINVVVPL